MNRVVPACEGIECVKTYGAISPASLLPPTEQQQNPGSAARQQDLAPRPAALASPERIETAHGPVHVARRAHVESYPQWAKSFAGQRKDHRYYRIVEDTLPQGFEHHYFVLEDPHGRVRAIQPFFLLDQDLLQGAGTVARSIAGPVRRLMPRFLSMRTLMVGCAAGEGHLDHPRDGDESEAHCIAAQLHAALASHARRAGAWMIVLKEFPAQYRAPLAHFAGDGYTRIPSLPMTRVSIAYASFDEYMTRALSKVTRKNLRRKFRTAEAATADGPIEMQVVQDVTAFVDEVYPLYLQVYERSHLHFEKLTKEYLCRLGQEMPDKVRFFIWRRKGRAIAFSLCMINDGTLYDEYLGLDYSVALDLHLYFWTIRDLMQWGMQNGCTSYVSSALNYDPKLHLKCHLEPLDLYVRHAIPLVNFFLRRILPWVEPTRNDKTLQQFPNHADLWGAP